MQTGTVFGTVNPFTIIVNDLAPQSAMDAVDLPAPINPALRNEVTEQTAIPHVFKMSRVLNTVEEAWEEYSKGRLSSNTGLREMSIKDMDEQHGSKWRGTKSSTDGKFYARREALWKFVFRVQQERSDINEGEILSRLERARNSKRWSLRTLCEYLALLLASSTVEGKSLLLYESTSGKGILQ